MPKMYIAVQERVKAVLLYNHDHKGVNFWAVGAPTMHRQEPEYRERLLCKQEIWEEYCHRLLVNHSTPLGVFIAWLTGWDQVTGFFS